MRSEAFIRWRGLPGLILLVWLAGCDPHVVSEILPDTTAAPTPKAPPFPLAPEERTGNLPPCELSAPSGDYFLVESLKVGIRCADPSWDVHFVFEAGNIFVAPGVPSGWVEKVDRALSPIYSDSININEYSRDSVFLKVRAWSVQGDSTPVTAALYRFGLPAARPDTGVLVDSRDGRTYKTTRIGRQVWMAENLNYKSYGRDSGACLNQSRDSCDRYGRFYTWSAVSTVAANNTSSRGKFQGVCPSHWHVPSTDDWDTLTWYASSVRGFGRAQAGEALKSTWSWDLWKLGCYTVTKQVMGKGPVVMEYCPNSRTGNGQDIWGFAALSAGIAYYKPGETPNFWGKGQTAQWWGVDMENPSRPTPLRREMKYDQKHIGSDRVSESSTLAASLRCVFDSLQR